MHTTLSNRARRQLQLAAVGATALIATVAISGSAGATGRTAGSADPPRISIQTDAVCAGEGNSGWLDVIYDDATDGHVPQSGHEELLEGSTVVWSADGLYQEHGDYFNTRVFSENTAFKPRATWNSSGTYTYAVTIGYDDGVSQTQSVTVDMTDCRAQQAPTPPTTTAPTTAPAPAADRFVLDADAHLCGTTEGGAYVSWAFQDVPDGHYPATTDYRLLKNGVGIDHTSVSNGIPDSDGRNFAIEAPYQFPNVPRLEAASYSLEVTLTYEDGVTEKHIETFDLAGLCNGLVNGASGTTSPTTTTAPGGTLPETGSGDLTWIIGSLAGLTMTAGAVLFAGTRRSRIDGHR